MKKTILLIIVFQSFTNMAQNTFIKEIDANFHDPASIVATNDNGWLVLSETSIQLMKYSQCGDLSWSKNYDIINQNCCIGNQIVVGASDEIYLLTREPIGQQNTSYRITALTPNGDVVWSKTYAQSGVEYYPYSLLIDPTGDLIVYANISSSTTGFSTLTKIDGNGTIKWSKKYADGGTWGEAIVTQDSGFLMRRGDEFIKVDDAGVFEWATRVNTTSTYYYRAPIEVSDGYIFTKQMQGSDEVGFFKIDKLGGLQWGGGQFTSFSGTPNPLRNTSNGNFVTVLNTNTNSPTASTVIVELDKDLNVVKQNGISINTSGWYMNDIWFSKFNAPLVVGKYVQPNIQHIFFGKLDKDYKVGCDTIITTTFNFYAATSTTQNVGVSTNAITSANVPVVSTDASLTDFFTCNTTTISVVTLANDTVICPDTNIIIENLSADNFSSFLWSTGETTPTISVSTAGTYWLEASNTCSSTTDSDTMVVGVTQIQDPQLTSDTALCGETPILLDAEIPLGQYLWQDNSTSPTYLVTTPGKYYVDITSGNCVKRFNSSILSCEEYLIPNIFTPNGDGINDYFEILYFGEKSFECQVFNRWGILQFETNTARFQWEGTINGVPVSDGVYYYIITIGDEKIQGHVTLIR